MKLKTESIEPCGVYKLRIVRVIEIDENFINIGFEIEGFKDKLLWKKFSFGNGSWELDKFLREVGLNRKEESIKRGDLINIKVWGAIRVNKSITDKGTGISREIFAFHIITERNIRPHYIDEPKGEMPKENTNFYQILDFTKTVEFIQDESKQDSKEIQVPNF